MASNRLKRPRAANASPAAAGDRHEFTAEIPGLSPDRPLWRLRIEMINEAQGDGERLRVRAHLHSRLGEAISAAALHRPSATAAIGADTAKAPATSGTALAPAYRLAARGVQLALKVPTLRRLAEPLLRHDFDSWIELSASTANLAAGAAALMPDVAPLKKLGIEPIEKDGPPVQTWAGPTSPGGRPGFAQVSLLRFDRRHLPAAVAALLGDRPFSVAGAIVNVVEECSPPSRR